MIEVLEASMEIAQALILGIVQGLTEWLPISSSGHLVLLQIILLSRSSAAFIALVHAGTLLAVSLIFRRDVFNVIKSFLEGISELPKGSAFSSPERKLPLYILIGTVPVAILGLALAEYVDEIFGSSKIVGVGLLITAALLYSTKWAGGERPLDLRRALIVGLAQSIAIFPGISRSGATISAALLSGLKREEAVRYSFLLSIPALTGFLILELMVSPAHEILNPESLVGLLSSFITGLIAIKFLLSVIRRGELHLFSYYCAIVGIAILLI